MPRGKYKRTPEMRANYSKGAKNRKYSAEGIEKLKIAFQKRVECSESQKRRYRNNPELRERARLGGLRSRISQQSRKPSNIEIRVREFLEETGVLFFEQPILHDRFLPDFYVPEFDLIIECDGEYWHSLPKAVQRDKSVNAYYNACGYNLLRLPESQIKNSEFEQIILDKFGEIECKFQ